MTGLTHPARRGFFLCLDGPDGGGKTTQLARLVVGLRQRGHEVVSCRDPGGTALGDRLRALLLDRHDIAIAMRSEMLLYMASRAQMVAEVIQPALDAGRVVVCDRYVLANVVYQGHAGGLPVEEIWRVGLVATGGLLPDLTVVLDVPPEVAEGRVGPPRDRIEDRPRDYRDRVRRGFLTEAETYPAPLRVIDASGAVDEVAANLEREVGLALGRHTGT